ncbi:amino-acid permease BAT1 homolog [Humulus lupulus]|uniref:amino-acid permease BAT1 homolog n=1 Tax=Humulus lupulus TaxID=3486 RepID=UPI002B4029CE|nr:amino-acid permease BAT1 homolog [Humulus lupulus]
MLVDNHNALTVGSLWSPVIVWAITLSVDFSLAQLIQVIILISTGGKTGGGYEASKYSVIAFHGGILLLHAITNNLPISWLSFFGQLVLTWNIVGVFVLIILIPSIATERASVKYVFTHFNTDNGQGIGDSVYIFILGLLMSQYSLTGYDASAHMTEETKNANKNGPRGIISAVRISIIVGLCYILDITFAVTNITSLLDENNDSGGYAIAEIFYQAFKSRYGSGVGGIVCLGVVIIILLEAVLVKNDGEEMEERHETIPDMEGEMNFIMSTRGRRVKGSRGRGRGRERDASTNPNAEEISNLRMPLAQPAAPAAPAVDFATKIARLGEQLRQRDEELA